MKKIILLSINLLIISTLSFGQITPTSSSVLIEPNNTNGIFSKNSEIVSYDAYLSQPLAASGSGTRLMWIPAKSAFRVGTVLSTNWDTSNIGTWSFASGFNTLASGRSSTAFGNQTKATQQYATAFGTQTTASGFASTTMGESTTASGSVAVAIGSLTSASGPNSFAAGQETTASGFRSAAFGWQTTASGTSSFALGTSTIASGNHAVSMGNTTTASGENAVAMGEGTTALAYSSLAVGTFNDEIYTSSPTYSNPTDPLFILGNGTDINNRSNAMMVLKNGNVGIGSNAPTDKLTVQTTSNSFGFTHTDGTVSISSYIPNIFGATAGVFGTKSNHSLILMSNGLYQAYLLSNGNLGIGTSTPAEKLEVNGDVRIDNLAGTGVRNVSADANGKLVTTVQTHIISIPPAAFQPSLSVAAGTYIVDEYAELPNGSFGRLVAPVLLPDGATIIGVKLFYRNNTSSRSIYCVLKQKLYSNNFTNPIFEGDATTWSSGSAVLTYDVAINPNANYTLVNNSTSSYYLKIYIDDSTTGLQTSWTGFQDINGVIITYTK